MNFQTYTFGCKVNKADTVAMEERLKKEAGGVHTKTKAPDLVVVNTCTVTASADRQARQYIRRVHRKHPSAQIVVTGCYAEKEPERFRSVEGVSHVVPIREQWKISETLGLGAASKELVPIERFGDQTRAFLKMQDGCNAYCSFCVLPYVRGRSRSIPLKDLVTQAESFERNRYREIVVTGTHIGVYGHDFQPRTRLSNALCEILEKTQSLSIRVSSLEPTTLTPDIIRLVSEEGRIRPHFHIPLQSGSDDVLRRMNRKYRTRNYADRIRALARTRDEMAIGADVIVGYPLETQSEFDETVDSISSLPITYLHVFPFSPRPGTRAGTLMDNVQGDEKHRRLKIFPR